MQPALRLLHARGPEVPAAPAPPDARGDPPRRRASSRDFGIEKIRLTGGEPTTRPDLVGIVRDLGEIGFPGGIALSTNGVLFPRMAHDLLAAGLTKVNVSLDAAEAEHFRKMTRRDHYAPVRESIELALSLPFDSVKVNAVVIRGFNDDQILPLAALTKDKKLGVRFIEFMPFGDNDVEGRGLDRLAGGVGPARGRRLRPDADREDARRGPGGRVLRHARPAGAHTGTLGFITPISDRFCDTCNRMRLTQDGFLKGCLFGHADVDLLKPMRAGATDAEIAALIQRAADVKEERHPMFVGMDKAMLPLHARNMSEIGG